MRKFISLRSLTLKNIFASPLLSGSMVMVGGSMAANMVNYLYHFVMGRIMTVSDYGNLAALYSLLYILSIVPISTSISIVKFTSAAKSEQERTSVYKAISALMQKIALILSILFLVSSPFIAQFLNISDTTSVALIAPILFLMLITLVNQATLQGLLEFIGVVIPNFVVSIVKLISGVLLIVLGLSLKGAMLGVFLGVLCGYFLSKILIKRKKFKATTKIFPLKSFLLYSLPALAQALAFTAFFSVDVILVKHFFDADQAGLYAAISTLGKTIYFAAQPITSVMFPIISKKVAEGAKYKRVLFASLGYTVGLCACAVIVFLFFPKLALFLYGQKYYAGQGLLVWMGLFISAYSVAYLLTNFFLSVGKMKIVILPIIIALLQAIIIWIFHDSLMQVIQISFGLMLLLSAGLGSYLFVHQKK